MNKNFGLNLNSEILTLNSALSKVKFNNLDIPVQISTQYNLNTNEVSKYKSSVSLSNPQDTRQPIRKILSEQRTRKSLANPASKYDIEVIKKKYNLPAPFIKNSRQLGNLKYKKPKPVKNIKPTILPKQFRENPQSDPPPITEKDVDSGILSLIHRGLIPKDVDVTPAFERGLPPLQMKTAQFHD